MSRPPAIQWYYKQWLGDNNVLGMDWDAQAMHFHLLMISIQEEPAGTIPNDMARIRRWLRLPSGQSDSDRVWARVQPQIFTAWTLENGRWSNSGIARSLEQQKKYRERYEKSTKSTREFMKIEDKEVNVIDLELPKQSALEEATTILFLELGVTGLQNRVRCQDAIRAYVHAHNCNEIKAAEELAACWHRYEKADIKFRTTVIGFLDKAVWKQEDTWTQKKSATSMGGW